MTHGTDIKALENAAQQAMLLYNERIDFFICAHKHREQNAISGYTDSGNSLVLRIPSICGMDQYAQKLGYGGKPGALALVIEAGYGRRCMYGVFHKIARNEIPNARPFGDEHQLLLLRIGKQHVTDHIVPVIVPRSQLFHLLTCTFP